MRAILLRELQRVNYYVEKMEYAICLATIAMTCIFTILQVFARYIFNHPLTWPEEASSLLLVRMTFAGAGILLKKGKHIEIDFFFNLFPKRLQDVLGLVICLLMLLFSAITAFGGYRLQFFQSHNYTVALRIPKSVFSLPLLITGISMCLYLFCSFLTRLGELMNPVSKQKDKYPCP